MTNTNMTDIVDLTGGGDIVDLTGEETSSAYVVEITGNPKALPRMRYFRNGFYNPARNTMQQFRTAIRQSLPITMHGAIFGRNVPVTLTIKFYLKRPNKDFVGGQRGAGRLRSGLPLAAPITPDIDNLAKLVLDSCNGLLYHDDRQVVKLAALKLRDNKGDCLGRTVVEISPFHE